MFHLPPQTILADVQTNVAAGVHNVAVLSEDFFRYGAEGLKANPDALISLVRSIRQIPQVRLIQLDHANLLSVAQYDDPQLKVLHDLLVGPNTERSVWLNAGVETASGELLREIGGGGKMPRGQSERWGEFRDEHVQKTLAWVESLGNERMAVFPLLYAPVDGSPALDPRKLRPVHWSLIKACYRLNFRWVPWIYGDNQAAAGVPLLRRAVLQLAGRGQMLQWKLLFAWHGWRAAR
jgi:hypothetical protein